MRLYTLTSDLHGELAQNAHNEQFIKDIEAAIGQPFDYCGPDFSDFGAVGDVISVTKWDRVIGTLSPQTNEPSTILTGDVSGSLRRGHILYLDWPGEGGSFDYTGQDGTLETIASRYDYVYAEAAVSSITDGTITCKPVTFRYGQAIVKFILNDGYGLPDFGCSAEPIEGRLQPIRVSLAIRPVHD